MQQSMARTPDTPVSGDVQSPILDRGVKTTMSCQMPSTEDASPVSHTTRCRVNPRHVLSPQHHVT